MERHGDILIKELKQKILAMGGAVERAIEVATDSLLDGQVEKKRDEVMALEKKINMLHIEIDDACVKLLAREHPFATDLRLIVAAIKMNCDLERMGDQAVNIVRNVGHFVPDVKLKAGMLEELPKMAEAVRSMVKKSLDAFVTQSSSAALEVLGLDDVIDNYKDEIFKHVIEYLKSDPASLEQGLSLILIARNFERIGDHATNIAEDVIFSASGRDVRHPHAHKNSPLKE
jgi:phosphate transport system protein